MSTAVLNHELAQHEPAIAPEPPAVTPDGARRGNSLAEQGYVQARFGDVPVLVAPALAAKIRSMRQVP